MGSSEAEAKAVIAEKLAKGMVIALKGGHHNKYCADEGETIKCNRGGVGNYEKFTVVDGGDGKIALRGGNNKKLCADTGPDGIKCNRGGAVGGWEKFTVKMLGGGKLALKGGHHNKYCADEGSMIKCNRDSVGGWETFAVEVLWNPAAAAAKAAAEKQRIKDLVKDHAEKAAATKQRIKDLGQKVKKVVVNKAKTMVAQAKEALAKAKAKVR